MDNNGGRAKAISRSTIQPGPLRPSSSMRGLLLVAEQMLNCHLNGEITTSIIILSFFFPKHANEVMKLRDKKMSDNRIFK